ncbi:MAG TPA: hypothetical protein VGJ53_00530 [Micromonosporaceae bacterium]
MPFDVYPQPQTAPLNVAAGATSALVPINERIGVDPATTLNTMFIRVVKLGTGCVPSGAPHPTIRLKANTGDAVAVPTFPTTVAIFNQPAGTGTEVANATLEVEANDVYRIRAFIFAAGSSWQIQIVNNDGVSARDFTWVVADGDADTLQPWIELPTTLTYDVLPTQAVPLNLEVRNRGTGPLTIGDAVGFSPGAGFALTTVPGAISPNACANLQVTFTGPAAPGTSNATYTATSNDTTAQLAAGHNRRTSLTATTRKLEVVLLVDASGSMNAKPNGDPIVAATDSRWSKLTTAGNQFLDLVKFFGGGKGRFGVARFPAVTPCPSSSDIQVAVDIADGVVDAAKTALAANAPGGSTPVGDGIGRVMGTVAGSFGYFEAAANAQQFNRRLLVLMSDGAHNCSPPPPSSFFGVGATSFKGKKISVITVGYGDPGASIYAPDHALLSSIVAESATTGGSLSGQFLDAGADDTGLGLNKSFRTAITAGLSLDPTTDPAAVLTASAPEVRRTIAVTRYESKAAFVVNWGTFDPGRVRVEILTPLCELITPSVARQDPRIGFGADPRYTMYVFDDDFLQNSADPDRPRHGDWTLIVASDVLAGSDREEFEYEVIFESRLKMTLSLDQTRYFAGDSIELTAALTLDGTPVTGASVTCRLDAPGQFVSNWLAPLKVTASQLATARRILGPADASGIAAKTLALKRRGITFSPFNVPTVVAMTDPSDQGTYRATFTSTTTPGVYDFYVTALGETDEGVAFRREKRVQVQVDVRPHPDFTLWETVHSRFVVGDRVFFAASVRVYPRDRFGNVYLVDPATTPVLDLVARGGEFTGAIVGNLDGSYTRQLRFAGEEQPVVSLRLTDRKFAAKRSIPSPAQMTFADTVHLFTVGREAKAGLNKHLDPRAALGDIAVKEPESFLSLGAFGSVVLGVEGKLMVGSADDDITVFVRPDEELRPYRVEVLVAGLRPRWVLLGESPGVSQSFSLAQAQIKSAYAVRITDFSGRTRTNELRNSATPGTSILGVGVRRTSPATPTQVGRFAPLTKLAPTST